MPFVKLNSETPFQVNDGVLILDAAINSGHVIPYSCKTGRCGVCKCRVLNGITRSNHPEPALSESEIASGWILSCVRSAHTDVVLEVEGLSQMHLPTPRTLPCRVDEIVRLNVDVVQVFLRLPSSSNFTFIPGQYISIIGDGGIRRSYSIANTNFENNRLELHIRAVQGGLMSDYWFNRANSNDLLRLHGPLGTFFIRNIVKRDLIFLATGTGLAPVKAMLEALPRLAPDQQPRSITVIWGARYEHELYFDVAGLQGVQKYIPVLSRAEAKWQGERGYVQDALLRRMSDLSNCAVYACGSDAMIRSAKSSLTAAGLPMQYFYSDAFVCSSTLAQ